MNSIHHLTSRVLPLVGALFALTSLNGFAELLAPSDAQITPHARVISPRLAALLAASFPRYVSLPERTESAAGNASMLQGEKGHFDEDILGLPKYIVRAPDIPAFHERDLYTPRGLAAIALKRYITPLDRALNRYRLPFVGVSTESRALAMYAEDERLENIAEIERNVRAAALIDRSAATTLKHLADATFQRVN